LQQWLARCGLGVVWSVSLSVSHDRAKTAELIVMLFGILTQVGPRNHVLDGGQDFHPHVKWQFWGQKGAGRGHARTCTAVDILTPTQQRTAPVRCRWRLRYTRCGLVGATPQMRLNCACACASAMQPYVDLLLQLVIIVYGIMDFVVIIGNEC